MTPEEMRRQRPASDALGAFGPGRPVTTPRSELALRLTLDENMLDLTLAALRARQPDARPASASRDDGLSPLAAGGSVPNRRPGSAAGMLIDGDHR